MGALKIRNLNLLRTASFGNTNDGNIISQADGGTGFRVHQAVLIESSTVLKDILKELEITKAPLFRKIPRCS